MAQLQNITNLDGGNLIAFPRADLRHLLGGAVRRHRLPEDLGQALVREAFDEAGAKNEVPVLLTSPQIRPFVRSIIERFRPQTVVMSQNEIHASVRLRTLGQV